MSNHIPRYGSFDVPGGSSTPTRSPLKLTRPGLDESVASTSSLGLDISFSRLTGQATTFTKPKAPARKKAKPTFICPTCEKCYVSKKCFQSHMMTHSMQGTASKLPDDQELLGSSDKIGLNAWKEMEALKRGCEKETFDALLVFIGALVECKSQYWVDFVHNVCQLMLGSIKGMRFLLPGKVLDALVTWVQSVSSGTEERTFLLNFLGLPEQFDDHVKGDFLHEFLLCFVEKLLQFMKEKLFLNGKDPGDVSVELDDTEKEVIYYIGGSIMRGFLKMGYRHKTCEKWQSIVRAIKKYIITDEPVGFSSWTLALDRGGLLYVTRECQIFFVELAKSFFRCEKKDGSISYSEVIEIVTKGNLCMMWGDMLMGQEYSLPEEISINFMNDVVEAFCKTCGRGTAKKKLNTLRERPQVSMPTRHMVASKKRKTAGM